MPLSVERIDEGTFRTVIFFQMVLGLKSALFQKKVDKITLQTSRSSVLLTLLFIRIYEYDIKVKLRVSESKENLFALQSVSKFVKSKSLFLLVAIIIPLGLWKM